MKLGICLPHYGRPIEPSRLAQIAARAEEMSLDSIWVTDHVIVPRDVSLIYRNDMLDPLAMLPWLAGVTERIALGTSVIVLPYRSPLPVAKLLASVDVLSGGRLIVGVAVGWVEGEFDALNVPFRERGRRTDEAIELFRTVWTQEYPEIKTANHTLDQREGLADATPEAPPANPGRRRLRRRPPPRRPPGRRLARLRHAPVHVPRQRPRGRQPLEGSQARGRPAAEPAHPDPDRRQSTRPPSTPRCSAPATSSAARSRTSSASSASTRPQAASTSRSRSATAPTRPSSKRSTSSPKKSAQPWNSSATAGIKGHTGRRPPAGRAVGGMGAGSTRSPPA